ncbi:MAG: MFS transporter, partial [Alphaproteobacteria bacterium]|nr:MFS transporter [Alphaproteobacteria bacterium]
ITTTQRNGSATSIPTTSTHSLSKTASPASQTAAQKHPLKPNCGNQLTLTFLIGYVLAFILKDWHITYGQSAVILVSAGLGAVPGAFFWGWIGDRIGRRTVVILTALNVAIATGIMYFTPGQDALIPGWIFLAFFRFFVGFGNAELIAVDILLAQEFVPSSKRGWVSGLTASLLPAGNVLGAISGAYLAPYIGWRGLFLVGLTPALLVLLIRYWVPESPRYLLRMGRPEEAHESLATAMLSLAALFAIQRRARRLAEVPPAALTA